MWIYYTMIQKSLYVYMSVYVCMSVDAGVKKYGLNLVIITLLGK